LLLRFHAAAGCVQVEFAAKADAVDAAKFAGQFTEGAVWSGARS
jgi:hypothetical protein